MDDGNKEKDMNKDDTYVFTFGLSSDKKDKFIEIKGHTYYNARAIMFKNFRKNWAFQYPNRGIAGVDRFGLTELVLTEEQLELPEQEKSDE